MANWYFMTGCLPSCALTARITLTTWKRTSAVICSRSFPQDRKNEVELIIMRPSYLSQLFSLEGKVAAITGGMGVIATEMVAGLASAGAKVAILDLPRRQAEAEQRVADMEAAGQPAMALFG